MPAVIGPVRVYVVTGNLFEKQGGCEYFKREQELLENAYTAADAVTQAMTRIAGSGQRLDVKKVEPLP